jgi:O-antigen ligase
LDHAHNDYVEFWIEYGLLGLAAFGALSLWLAAGLVKPGMRGTPSLVSGGWGGAACLAAIACVDFPFHRPAEWALYWVLLAILRLDGKGYIDECER